MPSDRKYSPREPIAAAVGDSLARGFAVVAVAVIAAIVTSFLVTIFR